MKYNNSMKYSKNGEKKITLATWCTIARIVLSPVLALLLSKGYWYASFCCFVVAALSDACDGALARLRNEQTMLGAWLDPLADKILLVTCLFTLASADIMLGAVPYWLACLVLAKESLLLCGVMFFYTWYGYIEIRPTFLSKITTAVQLCFIGVCLASRVIESTLLMSIGDSVCPLVAVMVVVSLMQYASIGLHVRKKI